jgi:hypothetical protein
MAMPWEDRTKSEVEQEVESGNKFSIWNWLGDNSPTLIENIPDWYCMINPKKCQNGGNTNGNTNGGSSTSSSGSNSIWIGLALGVMAVILLIVVIRK